MPDLVPASAGFCTKDVYERHFSKNFYFADMFTINTVVEC